MAAYAWPRHLVADSMTTQKPIWPSRGVAAGPTNAGYKLGWHLIEPLKRFKVSRIPVESTIYVDDISFGYRRLHFNIGGIRKGSH